LHIDILAFSARESGVVVEEDIDQNKHQLEKVLFSTGTNEGIEKERELTSEW